MSLVLGLGQHPPATGPTPAAPAQDAIEVDAVATAKDWPAWGHRKVTALLAADGLVVNASTVKRVLRRNDLLLPVNHPVVTRELAAARRAAFVVPPSRRNQVWQLDFSGYETTDGAVDLAAGRGRGLLGEVRARVPRGDDLEPP